MIVTPLRHDLIPEVKALLGLGAPFIWVRTDSDYWLYAALFSRTCPVAVLEDTVVGVVIAFRSQDNPEDVYIQDVMTHPQHRRRGITTALLGHVREQATSWGCRRIYLTSEPNNTPAHATWIALGFTNNTADRREHGVWITNDFKGPGKHRAVYELKLR